MVRTGAFGYLQYGREATFGSLAACVDKVFGIEQKVTNWNITNNRMALAALGQVEPAIFAYGTTRGSLGVDFVVSNPWFLSTLFDTVSTAGCMPTAGSHTHTYSIVNKLRTPVSVEVGVEQGGANITRQLLGGVVNSISLRSAIGEPIRGSADISYADEIECGLSIACCPVSDTCNFPYTFAYGNLTTTAGTIAEIQSFDINMNQNSDLLYTHNTSLAADGYRKLMEVTGSFTASYLDTELLRDIYAQAHCAAGVGIDGAVFAREQTTLSLIFNNGLVGAGTEKTITLTGTGVGFADHAVSIEPNEPIFETINWQIRTLSPVAVNQTATAL